MLFLFLHRSDGRMTLEQDGWTRAAECLKAYNEQPVCSVASECLEWSAAPYGLNVCKSFPEGNGRDISSAVFYRQANKELKEFTLAGDYNDPKTIWGIIIAVDGDYIDMTNPIRSVGLRSIDNVAQTIFPSVDAEAGDILLLSSAHDDLVSEGLFSAPPTTTTVGYVNGLDEVGILFAKQITSSGPTGELQTVGVGNTVAPDRELMISIAVRGN